MTGPLYNRLREVYTGEKDYMKILNNGGNVIPMVHVLDCAGYIGEIVRSNRVVEGGEMVVVVDGG